MTQEETELNWVTELQRAFPDSRNCERTVPHSINCNFCVLDDSGTRRERRASHQRPSIWQGDRESWTVEQCRTGWWSALAAPNLHQLLLWDKSMAWEMGLCWQLPEGIARAESCWACALFTVHPQTWEHQRATAETPGAGFIHSLGHWGSKHFLFTELQPEFCTIGDVHWERSKTGVWSTSPGRTELPQRCYLVVNLEKKSLQYLILLEVNVMEVRT